MKYKIMNEVFQKSLGVGQRWFCKVYLRGCLLLNLVTTCPSKFYILASKVCRDFLQRYQPKWYPLPLGLNFGLSQNGRHLLHFHKLHLCVSFPCIAEGIILHLYFQNDWSLHSEWWAYSVLICSSSSPSLSDRSSAKMTLDLVGSGIFFCPKCDIMCMSQEQLNEHYKGNTLALSTPSVFYLLACILFKSSARKLPFSFISLCVFVKAVGVYLLHCLYPFGSVTSDVLQPNLGDRCTNV